MGRMSEADFCDDDPWNKQADPTPVASAVVSLHSVIVRRDNGIEAQL